MDSVPEEIRIPVRNHGGGHANHTMFWNSLHYAGGGEPDGKLAEAIGQTFGSIADFKQTFSKTATTLFSVSWGFVAANFTAARVALGASDVAADVTKWAEDTWAKIDSVFSKSSDE